MLVDVFISNRFVHADATLNRKHFLFHQIFNISACLKSKNLHFNTFRLNFSVLWSFQNEKKYKQNFDFLITTNDLSNDCSYLFA